MSAPAPFPARAVDLVRGRSGFGFTLSGQSPAVVSSVVSDSPASHAGLCPGDTVVAANGIGVANSSHEEVVRIIAGSSDGVLRMQIGPRVRLSPQRRTSDSTDDDDDGGGKETDKENILAVERVAIV